MNAKLLMSAAVGILLGSGGVTLAQMQGGNEGQNMNQQMQQMQEQNPHMQRHNPGEEEQATPEEGQQPGSEQQRHPAARGDEMDRSTQAKALTDDQKARLHQTVIESRDAPKIQNVSFTLRVGTSVPRSVRVVPVPQEIVTIHPEWNGFLYFVSGDEIVVVDPSSYAIVGVLEA